MMSLPSCGHTIPLSSLNLWHLRILLFRLLTSSFCLDSHAIQLSHPLTSICKALFLLPSCLAFPSFLPEGLLHLDFSIDKVFKRGGKPLPPWHWCPLWLAPAHTQSASRSQRAFSSAPMLFPSIPIHWRPLTVYFFCLWLVLFLASAPLLEVVNCHASPRLSCGPPPAELLLPFHCWLGWRANGNAFWREDGGGVNSESGWFYRNEHINGG